MPSPPLRIRLDDAQRAEFGCRLGQPALAPRVRRRLDALRLADQGWTGPQIAEHGFDNSVWPHPGGSQWPHSGRRSELGVTA